VAKASENSEDNGNERRGEEVDTVGSRGGREGHNVLYNEEEHGEKETANEDIISPASYVE
jgi:hypothetical protein